MRQQIEGEWTELVLEKDRRLKEKIRQVSLYLNKEPFRFSFILQY